VFTRVSWFCPVVRRFVSAVVCVALVALGLALDLSGSVASAQVSGAQGSGGLPDWVNLSGTFGATGSSSSDPVWVYQYPEQLDG